MSERRTKRRYAHELYPHSDEWETRPLDAEVPYRIARAIGFDPHGTGWFDAEPRMTGERTMQMINETRIALLAVALHKGMTGDEAWTWADESVHEEMFRLYESAPEYGVDPDLIKPYPCGPEPEHHDHLGIRDARGYATVTRVAGKESECPECTEPVPGSADPVHPPMPVGHIRACGCPECVAWLEAHEPGDPS